MIDRLKLIVDKQDDGSYVAYTHKYKGVVVAQGSTFQEVMANITSAVEFHQDTFFKKAYTLEELIDSMDASKDAEDEG